MMSSDRQFPPEEEEEPEAHSPPEQGPCRPQGSRAQHAALTGGQYTPPQPSTEGRPQRRPDKSLATSSVPLSALRGYVRSAHGSFRDISAAFDGDPPINAAASAHFPELAPMWEGEPAAAEPLGNDSLSGVGSGGDGWAETRDVRRTAAASEDAAQTSTSQQQQQQQHRMRPPASLGAPPVSAASTNLHAKLVNSIPEQEPIPTFAAYVRAEASPLEEKLPTSGIVWGQTERDTVYMILLHIPYQFERLIQFSLLLCLDCFVGVITLLPLRCVLALPGVLARCLRLREQRRSLRDKQQQQQQQQPPIKAGGRIGGGHLFDLLCLLVLISVTVALRAVRPGYLYYLLRDMSSEFLKMSVLVAAFEIADKILGNFSLKVLEALSDTCTAWDMGQMTTAQLACDALVAFAIVLVHALCLMCQALILSIALNSRRHGLLALLIGSNFYEIKGTVFKRWDGERIRKLAYADFCERFQLVLTLVFVVVEDMESSASWQPSWAILKELWRILGAEMVVDVIKHAVINKLNNSRPEIYREFMKDLCDKVSTCQSHNLHVLLRFPHLACCALFLRSAVTLFWLQLEPTPWKVAGRAASFLLCWLALLVAKALCGYGLKLAAYLYVQHHVRGPAGLKPRLSFSQTAGQTGSQLKQE